MCLGGRGVRSSYKSCKLHAGYNVHLVGALLMVHQARVHRRVAIGVVLVADDEALQLGPEGKVVVMCARVASVVILDRVRRQLVAVLGRLLVLVGPALPSAAASAAARGRLHGCGCVAVRVALCGRRHVVFRAGRRILRFALGRRQRRLRRRGAPSMGRERLVGAAGHLRVRHGR
eukprot:scaffold5075_cov296-Prasinococcus_capsulatus_cf.AAC.9